MTEAIKLPSNDDDVDDDDDNDKPHECHERKKITSDGGLRMTAHQLNRMRV